MFKSQDMERLEGKTFSELEILHNRLGAIHQVATENAMQRREIQSNAMFTYVRSYLQTSGAGGVFCVAIYSSLLYRVFEEQVTRQEFAAFNETTFFVFVKNTLAKLTAEANMTVLAELPGLNEQDRAELSRWARTFRSDEVLGNFYMRSVSLFASAINFLPASFCASSRHCSTARPLSIATLPAAARSSWRSCRALCWARTTRR